MCRPTPPLPPSCPPRVSLVGAGPGDPELLTLRALQRIRAAQVLLYDHLVSPAVLALVPATAERVCVGKRASRHTLPQDEINRLLVAYAQGGRRVVRLKGGDPLLFGRGGEEMQALQQAGIACEVVPGISAALGAAASCGIPLTHRDHAQGVHLVTGHRRAGEHDLGWARHSHDGETLVVYMGLTEAGRIAAALMAHGRHGSTPVAVVERATLPQQRVLRCTLDTLARSVAQQGVEAPALLIVGGVVEALVERREGVAAA